MGNYSFGFNGKELDKEGMGGGASTYDYGFRIYNSALGRFLSVDPFVTKFPWLSSYQYAANTPIQAIDLDGAEPVFVQVVYGYKVSEPLLNSPSQWYVYQYNDDAIGRTSVTDVNSFCAAAYYNARNNNYNPYKSIADRNRFYAYAQSQLEGKSKWFGAAEIVTRWNSVGAAEGINLWTFSSQTEDFLKKGNEYLFKYNMDNFREMSSSGITKKFTDVNGQEVDMCGLGGKTLDYALVQYEQTKVQDFIEEYKKNNPKADMKQIYKEVNAAMELSAGPEEVQKVMDECFKGGKTFNFEDYNDRVLLGQKIVDILYEKDNKK